MPLQDRRVVRYAAHPTRMFGSYTVTAQYEDGTSEVVAYGEPHYCLREAARRNAELAEVTLDREDEPLRPEQR